MQITHVKFKEKSIARQIEILNDIQIGTRGYMNEEKVEEVSRSDKKNILYIDENMDIYEIAQGGRGHNPSNKSHTVVSFIYYVDCRTSDDIESEVYKEDVTPNISGRFDFKQVTQIKSIVSIPWKETKDYTNRLVTQFAIDNKDIYYMIIWDTNVDENGEKPDSLGRSKKYKNVMRLVKQYCSITESKYEIFDEVRIDMGSNCSKCNSAPGCDCIGVPVLVQ